MAERMKMKINFTNFRKPPRRQNHDQKATRITVAIGMVGLSVMGRNLVLNMAM
jgi:hypothetical protein